MGTSVVKMTRFLNKFNNKKGLTLLEALMSTAIVGIGFIAVFNMVNFSVRSIDVSGERTKASYLVSMIAEDIIGHKNTIHGADAAKEGISFNADGDAVIKETTNAAGDVISSQEVTYKKFSDHLETGWGKSGGNICANKDDFKKEGDIVNLIDKNNEHVDAPRNKERKWDEILGNDRYLKCKSDKDIKKVRVFKLCKNGYSDGGNCPYEITAASEQNEDIDDKALFIGRVQINLNDGRKRRFLYFQSDYRLIK